MLWQTVNLQTPIIITEDLNAPKMSAFMTSFAQNKTEHLGMSNSKAANRSRSVGELLLASRIRTEGRD
jgi:hypothetical protein